MKKKPWFLNSLVILCLMLLIGWSAAALQIWYDKKPVKKVEVSAQPQPMVTVKINKVGVKPKNNNLLRSTYRFPPRCTTIYTTIQVAGGWPPGSVTYERVPQTVVCPQSAEFFSRKPKSSDNENSKITSKHSHD